MRHKGLFTSLMMLLLLSGCGSFGGGGAPASPPTDTRATRGGGYYLDDGPGANPPADLDSTPDAVPRAETLHRGAQRPYTVMGRNYVPMTAVAPYRARGVASWYGRRYHGKLTATGETYDMYGMSAAHPTLPLPSFVRVTSVANGKSVIVRVNDRGPFIDSRLIDLSYTAAYKLGVIAGGSAMVDVELIQPGAVSTLAAPAPSATRVPAVAAVAAPAASTGAGEAVVAVAAERTMPLVAENSAVYLQLAAFGSKENAEAYAARVRADAAWLAGQLQVFARDGLFRVRAGPYANQNDARQTAQRIRLAMDIKPVIHLK